MFRGYQLRARFGRGLGIGTLAIASTLALAAPAFARTAVDPSTLNPAPPDFFNADCQQLGIQIVCTLAFSEDPIVNEDSGIVCGSTNILFSQTRSVVGKRFYDADRNLTLRHFRESLDGTFRSPATGKIVLWTQHDTVITNLAVPGDLNSGTIKISGLETRAWLPSGGTVLHDTGTVIFRAGTDEILRSGGKHPFNDYFVFGDASALSALCNALG